MIGGNFVNRFNIAGRSYKVIPQIKRVDRLESRPAEGHLCYRAEYKLIPLSTIASIQQQRLCRARLTGCSNLTPSRSAASPSVPLDQALKLLEDEAAKILPKGYSVDYTGESRQLRVEGDKFLPAFGLAVVLIFLVLAAQFNSFRDPLIILLGSVPLAMFGALIFMFLKMPNPNVQFFTNGWTTTMNIYSQVGLVTLVGLIAKNAILIVNSRTSCNSRAATKSKPSPEAARTRLRPILMTTIATVAGHFPLVLVTGAGAKARNSIGLVLWAE